MNWTDEAITKRNAEVFGGRSGEVIKRNKYGVAPKADRTVDGIVFASKAEAARWCELRFLQERGVITGLERQPVYKFPMNFSYIADFSYWRAGELVVEDVKGVETPVFKLKRKCMIYFYPAVVLEVVKK